MQAVVLGCLCGTVFRNLTADIAGAQGRLGAIFFTLCLAALTSLTAIDLLSQERMLVLREVQSGYYRAPIYYLTKGPALSCSSCFVRVGRSSEAENAALTRSALNPGQSMYDVHHDRLI